MLETAQKVGFVSAHSSSNYSKVNAVDIAAVGNKADNFSDALKNQNPKIITRIENNCIHAEIPQKIKPIKLEVNFNLPSIPKDNTNVVVYKPFK